MLQVQRELRAALAATLEALHPGAGERAAFEKPKVAAHGDLAITAALQLAKALATQPRALAQTLVERLQATEAFARWVAALEIAGPGFLNLRLKPAAKQQTVREILTEGERWGRKPPHGRRVIVEFVSANPTGPLHVGHGRQAALGDAICNLLETQGWQVHREFYYNDAGAQIENLTRSVQARARGLKPGDPGWPADAYNGDYIQDIADDFLARKTVQAADRAVTASGDVEDWNGIRDFAVAYLRREQDLDLKAFEVRFDQYYLESSLYGSGRVTETVRRLIEAGHTYEADGALWLRTTQWGDDKDRVMRKSDGSFTYFVPDVAYHVTKWERGFAKAINIQGTDHHGTIARVRAGLQALGIGIPPGYPDYVLHTMVRVVRGGQEVKISKRAGSYVTLRDLIEWTSKDAVRFFLLSRKPDTEYTFDVDLAIQQNNDNPVYYVQYAHARICSVLRQWIEEEGGWPKVREKSYEQIRSILKQLITSAKLTTKIKRNISTLLANSNSPGLNTWSDFLTKVKRIRSILSSPSEAELYLAIEKLPLEDIHVRKHLTKLARNLKSEGWVIWGESLEEQLDKQSMPIEVAQAIAEKLGLPLLKYQDLSPLDTPAAQSLMLELARWPQVMEAAAADFAPHDVAFYLRELAAAYHRYYDAERILVDDERLRLARLALVAATARVLRSGLALLGVGAPDKM